MTNTNRSRTTKSSEAARLDPVRCEPLEDRRLLSASYSAVNLNRFVPAGVGRGSQITNTGLIAFSTGVYSLTRHRFYPAASGESVVAIDNSGDAVLSAAESAVIEYHGQTHSIANVSNANDDFTFTPSSLNDSGQVAGGAFANHHPQQGQGAGLNSYSVVYDSTGNVVNTQGSVPLGGGPQLPFINDAGSLTFNEYDPNNPGDGSQAWIYRADTQTTIDIGAMFRLGTRNQATGINESGQVVGIYSRGRSVAGFFEFDSATGTLHTTPVPAGEQATSAAIGDSGTMVGTVTYSTVARRGRAQLFSKAVLFTADGSVEDLASMTTLPTGASIVDTTSVNGSGDILADCAIANGRSVAFLLTPKT